MKLAITKSDHKRLLAGLTCAAEWEDSIAAIWPVGHPEWKKARRAATEYRQLRTKLLNPTHPHA